MAKVVLFSCVCWVNRFFVSFTFFQEIFFSPWTWLWPAFYQRIFSSEFVRTGTAWLVSFHFFGAIWSWVLANRFSKMNTIIKPKNYQPNPGTKSQYILLLALKIQLEHWWMKGVDEIYATIYFKKLLRQNEASLLSGWKDGSSVLNARLTDALAIKTGGLLLGYLCCSGGFWQLRGWF